MSHRNTCTINNSNFRPKRCFQAHHVYALRYHRDRCRAERLLSTFLTCQFSFVFQTFISPRFVENRDLHVHRKRQISNHLQLWKTWYS